MGESNTTYVEIFCFSLVLGLIFGFLYDIIRLIQILCGTLSYSAGKCRQADGVIPKIALGAGDVVYMLAVTVMFSLFTYVTNYGDFRGYMVVGAAIGCALYHVSLGRLVMLVYGAVTKAIRTAVKYVIVIPIKFLAKQIRRMLSFIGRNTVGRAAHAAAEAIRSHKTEKIRKQFRDDISFDS